VLEARGITQGQWRQTSNYPASLEVLSWVRRSRWSDSMRRVSIKHGSEPALSSINRCKASDDLALLHAESELGQLLARLDILEQLTERTHRGAR
jgi:hypothetical protein